MSAALKSGDWCFHEWTLGQISESGDGYWVFRTGMIETSGRNLIVECRPLSLRNAALSQHFTELSGRLHREGSAGLNYPDFHRHLVSLWLRACDAATHPSTTESGRLVTLAHEFVRDVLEADRGRAVAGIPLTRPRR